MVSINRELFDDRFAFKGEATDLQSNPIRHYDPTVGRWLNEEPIGYVAPRQTPTEQTVAREKG